VRAVKLRGDVVERLPSLLLAGTSVVAAALILYLNRDGNFFYDEWIWFSGAADSGVRTLFEPDNGHLMLVPRLIYKIGLSAFGTHYLPFRLISLSLVIANAVLLYLLGRRVVGSWLALAPAVLMLFLGSAWDVLAAGVGTNVNLAIASGLGAFLALERRSLAGDLAACGLLAIGFASFSGELSIALGCLVLLVSQGRWRRAWVPLVPTVLFGIWLLQAPEDPGAAKVTVDHLGNLPLSMFDSASSAMAAATGFFPPEYPDHLDVSIGRPLAAVGIVVLGYVLMRRGWVTPRFLAYATVVVSLWAMIGAAGREATLGRYNVEALPFLFLALFELVDVRPRWQWALPIGAVLGFALLANLAMLRNGAAILRFHGEQDRATLAALELQPDRAEASPDAEETTIATLAGFENSTGSDLIYITAPEYLRAAEDFGSAGYGPERIAAAPEQSREAADRVLLTLLDLRLGPVPGNEAARGDCAEVTPGEKGAASIEVPSRGLTVRTGNATAELSLRRFAEIATAEPLRAPPGSVRLLSVPGDRLPTPWRVGVDSQAPVRVCVRGAGG
jgi:hypothetical protein